MKITVNSREVNLTQKDFLASGGQGSVYTKSGIAYKIYHDPKTMIPTGKIQELSVLNQPFVLRPLDVIYQNNKPVGYTMKHLTDGYPLCQMFTQAYKKRNNIDGKIVLNLVQLLQEGVKFVHSKDIIIVDLNEFNFLVTNDNNNVYFLDVDNYQTKMYPAQALMESVRDRHSKTFNKETDWFSFGIVSFQMFVGIHPFKGKYDKTNHLTDAEARLDYRMLNNISVLHPDVRVPSATLPFQSIPSGYLEWFKAVFEQGKRIAPPDSAQAVVTLVQAVKVVKSFNFNVVEYLKFDSDIVSVYNNYIITQDSTYKKNQKLIDRKAHVVYNGTLDTTFSVFLKDGRVECQDLEKRSAVNINLNGEKIFRVDNNLYVKDEDNIYLLTFMKTGNFVNVLPKLVNKVLPNSAKVFEGLVVDNILGRNFALVIDGTRSLKIPLPYLDSGKLVNAKYQNKVLMVVYSENGNYKKAIHKLDNNFNYDTRTLDVNSGDINFTVLDNGVVLHFLEDDELELFQNKKDSTMSKTFKDNNITSSDLLFSKGTQAMFARGKELYKFTML